MVSRHFESHSFSESYSKTQKHIKWQSSQSIQNCYRLILRFFFTVAGIFRQSRISRKTLIEPLRSRIDVIDFDDFCRDSLEK